MKPSHQAAVRLQAANHLLAATCLTTHATDVSNQFHRPVQCLMLVSHTPLIVAIMSTSW